VRHRRARHVRHARPADRHHRSRARHRPPVGRPLLRVISFFTTGRAVRAWARRHPEVTGTVLRRDGALRIGIDTFGALLQPADSEAAGGNQ
jgi:hypothetical protein